MAPTEETGDHCINFFLNSINSLRSAIMALTALYFCFIYNCIFFNRVCSQHKEPSETEEEVSIYISTSTIHWFKCLVSLNSRKLRFFNLYLPIECWQFFFKIKFKSSIIKVLVWVQCVVICIIIIVIVIALTITLSI